MKKIKKLLAFGLALMMCLGMAVTASAQTIQAPKADGEEDGKAKITINNASKGEIYTVYKIFEATYNETTKTIAYTYDGELPENDYFTQDRSTGAITAVEPGDALSEGAIGFLQTLATSDRQIKFSGEGTTETGGIVSNGESLTISSLAYGYYLITSTLNNGAAVAVDSTNPTATMYEKNTTIPSGAKKVVQSTTDGEVEETSVAYGEEVDFKLSITTQNFVKQENGSDDKQVKEYIVSDDLAEGKFTYKTGSLQVKVGGQVLSAEQYTLEAGNKLKVTVPWVSGEADNTRSLYKSGDVLEVTYTATLNEDAADIAGDGNANKAEFTWTYTDDSTGGGGDSFTDTATVYTYALAINKVDPKGIKLSGAKFVIKDNNGKALTVSEVNGVYKYDASSTSTELETNENGLIVVTGVKAGNYTVEETQAPQGYNRLDETFSVEAVIKEKYTNTITIYWDENGNITSEDEMKTSEQITLDTELSVKGITVVNTSGNLLPSTGGIGTTIFYVVGGLLAAGAGIILITKKRMKKEQ